MKLKIRTAQGDFVEFATEEERRAAVLDLLETRREATMVDKFVNDGQKLNLDEFSSFLDGLAAKYGIEYTEVVAAEEPEPEPKRKIKDAPQA